MDHCGEHQQSEGGSIPKHILAGLAGLHLAGSVYGLKAFPNIEGERPLALVAEQEGG
jgi:hypothetical protein